MNGYTTTIIESSMELTPKERVKMKDTSNCLKLDEIVPASGEEFIVTPAGFVVLRVENPNNTKGNTEYEVFVLVDTQGTKYVTGSESFMDAFLEIFNELKDETDSYEIAIYRRPSKNFSGKTFITCSVV